MRRMSGKISNKQLRDAATSFTRLRRLYLRLTNNNEDVSYSLGSFLRANTLLEVTRTPTGH